MELVSIDLLVLMFCSFVGSVKAMVTFDTDKTFVAKMLNVVVGTIVGMAIILHFGNELTLALSAVGALLAGASGAMCIEVFLQLLPTLAKEKVAQLVEKFK